MKTAREQQTDGIGTSPEDQTLFQRNPWAFKLFGLLLLSGGAFASIYFTASTTLPWVVSTASKVGLDLGFLSNMAPVWASLVTTAMGVGVGGVFAGGFKLCQSLVGGLKSLFGFGQSDEAEDKQQQGLQDKSKDSEQQVDEATLEQQAKLVQTLGVPPTSEQHQVSTVSDGIVPPQPPQPQDYSHATAEQRGFFPDTVKRDMELQRQEELRRKAQQDSQDPQAVPLSPTSP